MAGRIPQTFIDEVLQRTDIVDVIDSRVPLRKAGRDFKACCPFHDEKSPSFTVSQTKQFYHCFGCGANGTAISFLMQHESREFREAIEELAEGAGLQMPVDDSPTGSSTQVVNDLLSLLSEAGAWYEEQLRDHNDSERATSYLKQRGLTGQVAKEFKLGFAPDTWEALVSELTAKLSGAALETRIKLLDTAGLIRRRDRGGHYDVFRDRIIFPIEDHRGRMVAFGGRILGDGEPKYLNSPETPVFHKGRELYGLYRNRRAIADDACALVVEGYMDVVALAQHGINNAVATLGTATTSSHLQRLFRHTSHIIFCFDGDKAGRRAAARALDTALSELNDGRQMSFLFLPEGEDPDSLVRQDGAEAFRERIAQATPLSDVLFDEFNAQTDLNRVDGRARLVELARGQIAKVPGAVIRQLLIEQLAQLSRVDQTRVASQVGPPPRSDDKPKQRRRVQARPRGKPPSLLSRVIRMLIHYPEFAQSVDELEELTGEQSGGVALLLSLLNTARANPGITLAGLLERYRDTDYHGFLEDLASEPHVLAEQAETAAEFEAAVLRLRKSALERQMKRWLDGRMRTEPHEVDQYHNLDARLRDLQVRINATEALPAPSPDQPEVNADAHTPGSKKVVSQIDRPVEPEQSDLDHAQNDDDDW